MRLVAWMRAFFRAVGILVALRPSVVQLHRGDVILLASPHRLSPHQCENIKTAIEEAFPRTRCLVLDAGLTLSTIVRQINP